MQIYSVPATQQPDVGKEMDLTADLQSFSNNYSITPLYTSTMYDAIMSHQQNCSIHRTFQTPKWSSHNK